MNRRYFKIAVETEYGTGWWYGEFDGEWITRQIEVYLDRDEALIGGRDVEMIDQPLSETGLLDYSDVEITVGEFESIWERYA